MYLVPRTAPIPPLGSSVCTLSVYRHPPQSRMSGLWATLTRAPANWASLGSKGQMFSVEKRFRKWVDEMVLAAELASAKSAARPETIDWDDLRIRQATKEELLANNAYARNRVNWTLMKSRVSGRQFVCYLLLLADFAFSFFGS
jgi:hypothetical protein